MAITFPSSPSAGDIFTSNGKSWQYVNGKWESYGETVAPDVFAVDAANDVVHVYGSLSAGASASVDTDLVVGGDLTVDTSTLHVDSTNNRVGVGTAAPGKTLGVVGDASVSGDLYMGLDSTILVGDTHALVASPPSAEFLNATVYSGLTVPSGDFTVDTNTLHVDATNNRVGIGTTSPTERLNVATVSGSAYIKQENGTATTYLGPDSSNTGLFGTSTAHDVRFITSNIERMRIDSSGNVGIGTTNPGYPLHVVGDVALISSGSNAATHLPYSDGHNYFTSDASITNGGNHYFRWDAGSGSTYQMTILKNGNVGIGTTTPAYNLHVPGTVYLGDSIIGGFTTADVDEWPRFEWLRDTSTSINWDEGLIKGSSSRGVFGKTHFGIHFHQDRSFAFHTSGWDTEMEIRGDGVIYMKGPVGIGTAAPASSAPYENYKLTIDGGGFYTYETMSMINGYARVAADAAKPDTPGLLLNNTGANTVNWSTPGLWFTSTDSAFTTEKPKYLAGLVGRATSTYNDNNDAGMQISMYLSGNNAGNGFLSTTAYGYQFGAGAINPFSDNTASMGISARRWTVVYAASASINTSDVRDKTDIDDLDYGLDFVNSLRPVKYRYADRDSDVEGVRTHMGFIAQEVETVLGDDAPNRGLWTSSQFEKTDFLDEDENPVYSDVDRQGLRYEEMIAPMVKAIQELTARIEALESVT